MALLVASGSPTHAHRRNPGTVYLCGQQNGFFEAFDAWIAAQVAAWIRKRLPEQIKLPSDSFQISREHWERTMGRAREATWHLGTMLDHQVVQRTVIDGT